MTSWPWDFFFCNEADIDGLIAELNLKSTHNIKSPFKIDLFNALTEKELDVVEILKTDKLTIDQIYYQTNIEIGQLSLLLLNLELKNIVSVLPGKIYTLYQSM